MELKWPVDKCLHCGYNLTKVEPKAKEKGNDVGGKLRWGDFCPQCGKGYRVGDRVLPAPPADALVGLGGKPVLSFIEEETDKGKVEEKPSGVPPDERGAALAKIEEKNPDPEGLLGKKPEAPSEEKPEPGAVKSPGKGEYFCTKCASNHKDTDKPKSIGLRHQKYREA